MPLDEERPRAGPFIKKVRNGPDPKIFPRQWYSSSNCGNEVSFLRPYSGRQTNFRGPRVHCDCIFKALEQSNKKVAQDGQNLKIDLERKKNLKKHG